MVEASSRLIETLCEIRILRFNVPRKSTVLDVIPIRRELVSAILTNLWALSQSFRSRAPLPQYLPSTRIPLNELVEAIDQHSANRSRSRVRPSHFSVPVPVPDSIESSSPPNSGTTTPTTRYSQQQQRTSKDGIGRDVDVDGGDLGTLYSMAENEALVDLCNIIDQLIVAARTLFGSQTFWEHPAHVD